MATVSKTVLKRRYDTLRGLENMARTWRDQLSGSYATEHDPDTDQYYLEQYVLACRVYLKLHRAAFRIYKKLYPRDQETSIRTTKGYVSVANVK